jgi:hypothetical protein
MQVTIRQFVKDFKQACIQHSQQRALQLGKGQCKDIEEYKRHTGYIAGIEAAADLADQMLRQLEELVREKEDELEEMTGEK